MKHNAYRENLRTYLKAIKRTLPPGQGLGKTLTSVLAKSENTVYRKMRGDISLTLQEYLHIAKHFNIEIQAINTSEKVLFTEFIKLENSEDTMYFIDLMLHWAMKAEKWLHPTIWSLSRGLPFTYLLQYEELGRFYLKERVKEKYTLKVAEPNTSGAYGRKEYRLALSNAFLKFECVEFLNPFSVQYEIGLLQKAHASGLLGTPNYQKALNEMQHLIGVLEQYANHGKRSHDTAYKLFLIDNLPLNSTLMLQSEQKVISTLFSPCDGLMMETESPVFGTYTKNQFNQLLRESSLISQSGSKQRAGLFAQFRTELLEACAPLESRRS